MNSSSVLHWIIVFGILAGIVILVRSQITSSKKTNSITAENSNSLEKPMQWLTRFFITWVSSTILLIMMSVGEKNTSEGLGVLLGISVFAMLIGGFGFYICLGTLAKRLGKSWIIWVGLTFFTNPIGAFVAYFLMRNLITDGKKKIENAIPPN